MAEVVIFGNDDPTLYDGEGNVITVAAGAKPAAIKEGEKRAHTVIVFPDEMNLGDCFTNAQVAVRQLSDSAKPAWVGATSSNLANLLGETYGCEVRALDPAQIDAPGIRDLVAGKAAPAAEVSA